MERITSFSVDHTKLTKGIYISRQDGEYTTFDIRMTIPNLEPAILPEAAHTIEHIGATLLRNSEYKEQVLYFGPMGCMTGFYLITKELSLEQIIDIVKDIYTKIASWDDSIPGASKEECGNYSFMDITAAKQAATNFLKGPWEHQYHTL